MASLVGLATTGVAVNATYLGEWPHKLGLCLMNFSGIEYMTYQHLDLLEAGRAEFVRNIGQPFGQRVGRIKELLRLAPIPTAAIDEMCRTWDRVCDLAALRNRIMHNPVLPAWRRAADADTKPPDLLGIIDMRHLKNGEESKSITMGELDAFINELVELGKQLNGYTMTYLGAAEVAKASGRGPIP